MNSRRDFLGKLALGSAAGITAMMSSKEMLAASLMPPNPAFAESADEWFKKVKGKHKIVYDVPEPNDGFGVIWSFIYYNTNNATGTPDTDLTSVVVLRHGGIPLAMEDKLWEKYKLGEMFKITDATTNAPAVKNIYATTTQPLWTALGIQGINDLTKRGVMFCVCDVALTVFSGMAAKAINGNPEEVKKEWLAGLLPGVQVVPSGVWAVGRAQEKGCAYCFAGG
jgi:intracellular sulfur oxidation DsrE/DsrF family protein